jgi:hypothetical protein
LVVKKMQFGMKAELASLTLGKSEVGEYYL